MEATLTSSASREDIGLFTHIENRLYTAVVADCLDELGFRDQAMNEAMRPLWPEVRFCGWARTVSYVDVFYTPADPYGKELEAMDSILPGEVVVIGTGESRRNAPWGELLSTAAKARGARGAVVDGLVRDVRLIQQLGFPVFARGIKPVDSKGRGVVLEYNTPVNAGGVVVSPRDLIFADYDGVVVIPAAAVAETVRMATEKAAKEDLSRAELMEGAFLTDVYRKYGVL